MVFTDPYCIRLIVTERIQRLLDAGQLAEVEPHREYGYTCRAVFGVLAAEIAAIRDEDAGGRQLLWFHLNDGTDDFRHPGRAWLRPPPSQRDSALVDAMS
jgi:hypothetical protein